MQVVDANEMMTMTRGDQDKGFWEVIDEVDGWESGSIIGYYY